MNNSSMFTVLSQTNKNYHDKQEPSQNCECIWTMCDQNHKQPHINIYRDFLLAYSSVHNV